MTPELEQLAEEIAGAFADVRRGEGISLHEAEEIDCHGSVDERAAARGLDIDIRWQDVPDEWLEQFSYVPFFLDARGFRYYLPAYMLWSLRHPKSESGTEDSVVENLLIEDKTAELLPILNAVQRRSVCKWLRVIEAKYYVHDPERVDLTLQRYLRFGGARRRDWMAA